MTPECEKRIRKIVVGKNISYWNDETEEYLWMRVTKVFKKNKCRFGLDDFILSGKISKNTRRKRISQDVNIFGSNLHCIEPCKSSVDLQKERDHLVQLVKSIQSLKRQKDDGTRLEDSKRRLRVVQNELRLRSV